MSVGTQQSDSENFLAESLESLKVAKDDAREYHKLVANEPKTLQFIIEDKSKDLKVERKVNDQGKPYSETTFLRVINLKSEMQEPKPLRTGSIRLLEKLNYEFGQGNFTLEIVAFGEGNQRDFKVRAV